MKNKLLYTLYSIVTVLVLVVLLCLADQIISSLIRNKELSLLLYIAVVMLIDIVWIVVDKKIDLNISRKLNL